MFLYFAQFCIIIPAVNEDGENKGSDEGLNSRRKQRWRDGEKTFVSVRSVGGKAGTSRRAHRRGRSQWGYVYGTAYAEVKRVLIQRKAEAGFYNLNQTDLTFEVLAEVWLYSLKNAIKESTYAHYSYTLHKYLLPVLSKVPVASLEESFLEQAIP